MLRTSFLWIALLSAHALATAPTPICPNKVLAFADDTLLIDLTLEPHERVITGLRFLGTGDLIGAGIVAWEKTMHPQGQEKRSGRFEIIRSEDRESVVKGNYGNFTPSQFVSFENRPNWLGINWSPGPFTVLSYGGEEGMHEQHEITATLAHRGPGVNMVANSVEGSPDGKTMMAVYSTDAVVFNALSGQKQFRIQMDPTFRTPGGFGLSFMDATYSHDGAFVLSTHSWGMGGVWDGMTGEMRAAFPAPTATGLVMPGIVSSSHGNFFMVQVKNIPNPGDTGDRVEQSFVYRIDREGRRRHPEAPGEPKVELLRKFEWIERNFERKSMAEGYSVPLHFAPYDNLLVGSREGEISAYDMSANPKLDKPHLLFTGGHDKSPVTNIASSPNGDFFASASENGIVCLWGNQRGTTHYRFEGNTQPISFLQFSNDGRWLLINTYDPKDVQGGWRRSQSNRSYLVDLERYSHD